MLRPDGEGDYSAQAGAAAHAVGRVTCQPDGVGYDGKPVAFKTGHFHKARVNGRRGGAAAAPDAAHPPVRQFYREAIQKISNTQCDVAENGEPLAVATRLATSKWPAVDGETNANTEGGFCAMPTQFLSTIGITGGTTGRWLALTQNNQKHAIGYAEHQPCKRTRKYTTPPHTLPPRGEVALPTPIGTHPNPHSLCLAYAHMCCHHH